MTIHGHYDIEPENPYHGDPSMPRFKFPESEREVMRKRGMTDEEIDAREIEITNKQIQAKLDQAA